MKKFGYIAGKRVKVAGDQIVTAVKLEMVTTPLLYVTASGDIADGELDLDALTAAAGTEVPKGAIGIILDVEVWDSTSLPLVTLYKSVAEADVDQRNYISAQVVNVWIDWQGIVAMTANNTIRLWVTGATNMSLKLKLVGWIIAAE